LSELSGKTPFFKLKQVSLLKAAGSAKPTQSRAIFQAVAFHPPSRQVSSPGRHRVGQAVQQDEPLLRATVDVREYYKRPMMRFLKITPPIKGMAVSSSLPNADWPAAY
jgi:hypothetical protein